MATRYQTKLYPLTLHDLGGHFSYSKVFWIKYQTALTVCTDEAVHAYWICGFIDWHKRWGDVAARVHAYRLFCIWWRAGAILYCTPVQCSAAPTRRRGRCGSEKVKVVCAAGSLGGIVLQTHVWRHVRCHVVFVVTLYDLILLSRFPPHTYSQSSSASCPQWDGNQYSVLGCSWLRCWQRVRCPWATATEAT